MSSNNTTGLGGKLRAASAAMRAHATALTMLGSILFAVGSVAGFFAQDFLDFRSEKREEIANQYAEAQASASDVLDDLQELALVARGQKEPSEQIILEFERNLVELRQETEDVANRIPNSEAVFRRYETAMVEVRRAAKELKGPLSGKGFIEAWGKFEAAQDAFDDKVQEYRGSYL